MQPGDLETWKRLEALLDEALEQPPEAREAWLAEGCPDPALQSRLRALIAHAEDASGPLEALAARLLTEADEAGTAGRELGGYRLDALIGEGGMAVVWRASREVAGQRREVALKCLRGGLHSPELRARFIEEQAILARLAHPHIAHLYDAGVDPDGTPWIAMEWVQGASLLADADARRLDIGERIELFIKVAEAVAHAHGELVVHRDLKPANILVDRRGEPRLLDFGIARLLEPGREHAATTALKPLTPEYASPEQLAGAPVGVRSDLYSLGLVLHELLCGERAGGSVAERERAAPSTALRRSARADALAMARRRSVPRLQRELRGDLDLIVQRCLRVDPARRYASAAELADDLRRWQQRRPLRARLGHRRYRLQRFLQRNWLPLGAGVSVVVALLVGSTLALQQAGQAEQARAQALVSQARAEAEAERAGATSRFLVDLFRAQLPGRAPDELPSTRELLDRGLQQVRDPASGSAELRADLMVSLAEILLARLQFDEVQALAEEAATLAGGEESAAPAVWARVLHLRADLLRAQRRNQELAEALDEAIHYVERHLPEGPALFELMRERGLLELRMENVDAAERQLLALRARVSAHSDTGSLPLRLAGDLASVYGMQGRMSEAEAQHREVLALKRADPQTSRVSLAVTVFNLGGAAAALGRLDEARARFDEALELLAPVDSPVQVRAATLHALARLDHDLGHAERALALVEQSAQEWARVLGLSSPDEDFFGAYHGGRILADLGRHVQAEAALRHAIERMRARQDAPLPRIAGIEARLADLFCEQGRVEQAEAWLQAARASLAGADSAALGEAEARCALTAGRVDAAIERLRALIEDDSSDLQTHAFSRMRRELLWAEALRRAGREQEATALLETLRGRLDAVGASAEHAIRLQIERSRG